jgi:hypothetical protein
MSGWNRVGGCCAVSLIGTENVICWRLATTQPGDEIGDTPSKAPFS